MLEYFRKKNIREWKCNNEIMRVNIDAAERHEDPKTKQNTKKIKTQGVYIFKKKSGKIFRLEIPKYFFTIFTDFDKREKACACKKHM